MTLFTLPGSVGNVRGVSTSTGTALSTSVANIMLPLKTRSMNLIPRNFSTAVVARWTKIPWLTVLKTTDLLAAIANMTDYSSAAQDGSTSTTLVLSSLDTLVNTDAIYIGSPVPFIGLTVDVNAANSNAATILVEYAKNDGTWADISASDGTTTGGATFGQDGNITWTEPTAWYARELSQLVTGMDPQFGNVVRTQLFWLRVTVSAAMDSSTTLNSIIAMPRTTYAELASGDAWEEQVYVGPGGICGISAVTDAGTAGLIVNVATSAGGRY